MSFGFGTLNHIQLIGRLGGDPELTVTAEGKPITKFSLAVDDYKGKDNQGKAINKAQWFNVITWQTLAEMAERFVFKGNLVYVAGRLSVRDYTDKQGAKRQAIEVIADTVQLLEKRKNGDSHDFDSPDMPEL